METLFGRLLTALFDRGDVGISLAGGLIVSGLFALAYYRSVQKRLEDVPVVTRALLESAASDKAMVDQFNDATRARDALVAAMGALTFEMKANTLKQEAMAEVIRHEGEANRMHLANNAKLMEQVMRGQENLSDRLISLERGRRS